MQDEETGIPAFGDRRCLQRWWILTYCFPLSSFYAHLSAFSFCFLSNFWSREDDEEVSLLWICFDSGSFSVCRDESNSKANTPRCVAPLLFLLFSVFFFCLVHALCFVPLCFCSSSLLFSPARLPLPGFL